MSVDEIKAAIVELSADDIARLATWLTEFEAELWDRQIESDQQAGRLDAAMNRVRADMSAQRSRPI